MYYSNVTNDLRHNWLGMRIEYKFDNDLKTPQILRGMIKLDIRFARVARTLIQRGRDTLSAGKHAQLYFHDLRDKYHK